MGSADDVRALLRERGAETVKHPGGTLYAHLLRVHDRLTALGLDAGVCLAGLAHAAYGTDGFDVALLSTHERAVLRDLVGDEVERLVYRYCACDRARTWRRLAETHEVRDRFTGNVETLGAAELRGLVDLSIVNELDVIAHDPSVGERYGGYFRTVFASWEPLASAVVMAEVRRALPA